MFRIKNFLAVSMLYLLVACGSSSQTRDQTVESIDSEELKVLLSKGVRLLDVRTPQEYASGRIGGATLINYRDTNFKKKVATLEKETPLIVYCAAGGRSTQASKILMDLGFSKVYNYKGGFSEWRTKGEAVEID